MINSDLNFKEYIDYVRACERARRELILCATTDCTFILNYKVKRPQSTIMKREIDAFIKTLNGPISYTKLQEAIRHFKGVYLALKRVKKQVLPVFIDAWFDTVHDEPNLIQISKCKTIEEFLSTRSLDHDHLAFFTTLKKMQRQIQDVLEAEKETVRLLSAYSSLLKKLNSYANSLLE